jgi:two-component system CheB/CheR fusion protein
VIETACKGIYGARTLTEDGSSFHYLTNLYLKKNEGKYLIDPSLKKNICFFVHNLMNGLPSVDYDIVFFRNAFIYFSPHSREQVLSNISDALKEQGLLIMGVSETAGVYHAELEGKNRNDVFYFQKASV